MIVHLISLTRDERIRPQAEVMPHAAAVVGHGGFGTTLLALAAGAPQVVIPLFASDQFDNARRVAAVGAGTALEDGNVDERLAGDMVPAGPQAVEGLPTRRRARVQPRRPTDNSSRVRTGPVPAAARGVGQGASGGQRCSAERKPFRMLD